MSSGATWGQSPFRMCAVFVATSSIFAKRRCGRPAARADSSAVARKRRGEIAAGTYHVTLKSAGPVAFYHDDFDRTDFCNRLEQVIRRCSWTCRAFCLMPTHYHLVLDVEENMLQGGMSLLNGGYAQNFNRRHGRWGHLCGDRYGSVAITSDGHMLAVLRYVARNPVKAGLCKEPGDWIWGSYRGCAELDDSFPFVDHSLMRSYFGDDRRKATRLLRAFVEDLEPGTVPGDPPSPEWAARPGRAA